MRTFELHANAGVVIADGAWFPDGTAALRWRGDTLSTTVYATLDDLERAHAGHARVVWSEEST